MDTQVSRDNRTTVLLSDDEDTDVRLVASFHKRSISDLLREWAIKDITAEAANIRRAVIEVAERAA